MNMPSDGTHEHYYAVIDMGSNGIRFSISDLSPPTSRILPTVYQHRRGISLYDAQHHDGHKTLIPEKVIDEVLEALVEFKRICKDFGVQDEHVEFVATEATRNAINRKEYLERIEETTRWKPKLLSREEEAFYGALGIAYSVSGPIDGLVMDMGGGSVQITWMKKTASGHIALSCSRSYPYGAAALMARLPSLNSQESTDSLVESLSADLKAYFRELQAAKPEALLNADIKGLPFLLSGGGFRSWGHILMSLDHVQPYPIPIVNGYVIKGDRLLPDLTGHLSTAESHRISSRRNSQIPAIQILVNAIVKTLGDIPISDVTFCQGGVREGLLFNNLPDSVRSQNALDAAASPFAPRSASALITALSSALPGNGQHRKLIPAIVSLLYYHGSHPKDIRAAAALRSTTTGVLASTHGISQYDRAVLALILCERWGGEDDVPLSDRGFLHSLEVLEGAAGVWWAKYLGSMANGLARVYPAGLVQDCLVKVNAKMSAFNMRIIISPLSQKTVVAAQHWAKQLEKLGKRKNCVGGAGTRFCLELDVSVDLKDVSMG